jgi:outer membrane biogenesis lipoprotein LolB
MIRNTLLAAAAVLALMTGSAMAQTAQQNAAQQPTWANAHDTDYGYNHYPQ